MGRNELDDGSGSDPTGPCVAIRLVIRTRHFLELAARSLETIHFGPEYCGRALSQREGGEWGDGNECTGDEAPCRRERSETADGRCGPGRGKGSGSCREDNLQGRDRHNRDGIYDFIALERVLMIRDRSAECLADGLPARIFRFEGYVACEGGFAARHDFGNGELRIGFGRGDDGRRNHVPRETARTRCSGMAAERTTSVFELTHLRGTR